MGEIKYHRPVLLLLAVFSRHQEAIDWAHRRGEQEWGPLALESEIFDFAQTAFYEEEMGPDLLKTFFVFERLIDPAKLPEIKHLTNRWETDYVQESGHSEARPLNLDPGYITLAKLVLATTKDRDHRLYLANGIYAEGTLHYQSKAWRTRPWTYPDYQRSDYHEFFTRCREYLRGRYKEA